MLKYEERETMPQCENCDKHISEQFQRVFGDKNGNVYACPKCSANAGIGDTTLRRSQNNSDRTE
jgi:predicted SprT family Zn-dependent metalloprotease